MEDPVFVKAIYGKAESLFNLCQFEHALVQYYQGKVGKLRVFQFVKVSLFLFGNFENPGRGLNFSEMYELKVALRHHQNIKNTLTFANEFYPFPMQISQL